MEMYEFQLPRTSSERAAAQAVRRTLKNGAEDVGAQFTEPDDDWALVWLICNADGRAAMMLDFDKNPRGVAAWAREFSAIAVGSLASSWSVAVEDVGRERMKEIQDNGGLTEGVAERVEQLTLCVTTATLSELHCARIIRSKGLPPKLDRWEHVDEGTVSGLMVEPIRAALVRLG